MRRVLLFLFMIGLAASSAFAAKGEPGKLGKYIVTAEILPIMKSPGGEYTITEDGGIEYSDDIEGVVVYGNRLTLRPEGGWFALLSPEGGRVLGYIPGDGVDPLPTCEPLNGALYMAVRDAPALSLTLKGGNDNSELPDRSFSLLKGEVVPSYGRRDGKILLSFGTIDGDEGVGGRFVWADEKDFIALDSYKPDNTKADRGLIPAVRRLQAWGDDDERVEKLPKNTIDSLEKRGFMIDGQPLLPKYVFVDDMADLYAATGEYEADFITTDIFLHAFHLLFDQMLQKFERTYLAPQLAENLSVAIDTVDAARKHVGNKGAAMQSFDTAQDMLSVASALLADNAAGRKLSPRATGEVKKIMAASETTESEITGQKMDYTLFKPRGHYTISTEYEQYFRAMSYIGLAELPMFGADGKPIVHNITATAIISLVQNANLKNWEAFEDSMTFLVGVPNAGDPKLYRQIVHNRLGGGGEKAWRLLDDKNTIAGLAEDIAKNVPGPKIQSVVGIDKENSDFEGRRPVFRISPKRFTYDAYIMNLLTSPRVGTDVNPRNMPKGTDVMAVFGSRIADMLSKGDYDKKNYRTNLAELKAEVAGYLAGENTVYASWLDAFRAGLADSGSEQFFYRSEGWHWKKLATNLASWAELKHDTILYAEQSAAEMGDGGDWYAGRFEPPQPRGYVEPDPQFFEAMLRAADRLQTFIKEFGVEDLDADDETKYSDRLGRFSELLMTMRNIAQKEVAKEAITPAEYASIKGAARAFDAFLLLPGSGFPMDDGELRKMACVADVATNGWAGTVLEAASGAPCALYVFVNDKSGGARVTKGYVFSYYEFERPMSERMTDEEWRAIVYDPNRADELEQLRPDWYGKFRENTQ